MDHLPFWSFPTNATSGVGYGQGTAEIIEFVADLTPSKWTRRFGWLDPDFLMTLFAPTMGEARHPTRTMPRVASLHRARDGCWWQAASRTEVSFWAMWSSPLLVATDVRNMTAAKRALLMNPEVIAIDQARPQHTTGEGLAPHSTL